MDLFVLERREFLEILYTNLPDKSFVRTGCAVKSINQHASGVEVTLQDGTIETGDMVLGADGVSSLTRTLMWNHADQVAPGLIPKRDRSCMKTTWKALIGLGPPPAKLGRDVMMVVHNTQLSFLILTQPNRVFWFVFFRMEREVAWPERAHFSMEEAEKMARGIADHPLGDHMTFSELWESRDRGMLIPIEEGVLDVWHHDRIVLAGDAAHKVRTSHWFCRKLYCLLTSSRSRRISHSVAMRLSSPLPCCAIISSRW
jgi:2-polyprenyl-6-methoxyphenol hydroxylase-like FAD-dependent oxidoreductase